MVEPFFPPRPSPHSPHPSPCPCATSNSCLGQPVSPPHSSLRPLCVACKPCQLQKTPPSRLCNSCATLRASGVAPSVVPPASLSRAFIMLFTLVLFLNAFGMHSQAFASSCPAGYASCVPCIRALTRDILQPAISSSRLCLSQTISHLGRASPKPQLSRPSHLKFMALQTY